MEQIPANTDETNASNLELLGEVMVARELGFTAIEVSELLEVAEEVVYGIYFDLEALDLDSQSSTTIPTGDDSGHSDAEKRQNRGPRKGHFSKQFKHNLAAQGRLNAKDKMSEKQKKLRRRKRKRK